MSHKKFEAIPCAGPGEIPYVLIHFNGLTHIISEDSIRPFAKDAGIKIRDIYQRLADTDWVGFDIEGTLRSSTTP